MGGKILRIYKIVTFLRYHRGQQHLRENFYCILFFGENEMILKNRLSIQTPSQV